MTWYWKQLVIYLNNEEKIITPQLFTKQTIQYLKKYKHITYSYQIKSSFLKYQEIKR